MSEVSDFFYNVDYQETASIRINLAMDKIQKLTALSYFDDSVSESLAEWISYYKKVKLFIESERYLDVFNEPIPE